MPYKNKVQRTEYMKIYMQKRRVVNPIPINIDVKPEPIIVNPIPINIDVKPEPIIVNPVKKVVKIITIRKNHHYDFMRWVYKNHEVMEEMYEIHL